MGHKFKELWMQTEQVDQPVHVQERLSAQLRDEIFQLACEAVRAVLKEERLSIEGEMQRQALIETAAFVLENVPLHVAVPNRRALHDRAIDKTTLKGLVLEFGVFKGASINHLARRVPDRQIFGFDSFEGLPGPWVFRERAFTNIEGLPQVERNVTLIKGWFNETLPMFLQEHADEQCALVHVDSDLYESAVTILNLMKDRFRPGTVIIFDEYMNYPGWKNGEFRAWNEFVEETGLEYEYIGFANRSVDEATRLQQGGSGYQVAVKITSI